MNKTTCCNLCSPVHDKGNSLDGHDCGCECHQKAEQNYVDSRTPEEREKDLEMQKNTVYTDTSQTNYMYLKVEIPPKLEDDFDHKQPMGWEEELRLACYLRPFSSDDAQETYSKIKTIIATEIEQTRGKAYMDGFDEGQISGYNSAIQDAIGALPEIEATLLDFKEYVHWKQGFNTCIEKTTKNLKALLK